MSIPVKTVTHKLDTSGEILETVLEILDERKKIENRIKMYLYIILGIFAFIGFIIFYIYKGNTGLTIIIASLISALPIILRVIVFTVSDTLQDRHLEKKYSGKELLNKRLNKYKEL